MAVTWGTALAWRLRRHLLDPVGTGSVVDVVRRLGAVPAWPDATCELGVAARRTAGRVGDATQALADREVVKVFAFSGATHLMTPQDAGAYLAVRASSRMWELPSWQEFYGLAPSDWPAFREYVRDALAGRTLTRSELVAALRRSRRYRQVGDRVGEGNDTVLKPLSWLGDMGFANGRDGEPTFLRLADVPGWAGLPDVEDAGPAVVAAHFRTHGPTTPERVLDRVSKSLGAKRRDAARWLSRLDDRLETLTVEGEHVRLLREDVEELLATEPSTAVRLLPARDPWLMVPGTSDVHVVPPGRRDVGSRLANLVVQGGVVSGTWKQRGDRLDVAWFGERGQPPTAELESAAGALGASLGRTLTTAVQRV